ncbi:hypothetical protein [Catenulispora yoronensis]|uniref:hypothetical protein n=1 Tax=Catenulispora yoronensis TaxID=450799 RepID=UPI003CD05868
MAILLTLLTSTLGFQLFARSEPAWARGARLAYRAVWPQGWTFFDNNADFPALSAFRLNSGMMESSPLIPRQMSSQTLWGLTGASQARSREAQYVVGLIPAASWRPCDGPVTPRCLSAATPLSLVNQAHPASLCGRIAFVLTAPQVRSSARQDTKVAVLNLACPA